MEYLNIKNKKIRFFAKKTEKKMFIYKAIQINSNWGRLTKLKASNLLIATSTKIPFYQTAFVKRCILSKRKNKVNSLINVSRLIFLNFARSGEIHGIKKAVW